MKKDMEQYIAILRQSYDAQAEYMKEVRGMKHDMQAHMIILQYYLEEGAYERAKAYLKEMQAHQVKMKRLYVDTGNNMINALISECWKQSAVEIEVNCYGEIPDASGISEYDLCTIFFNLFSNAVEACEKLVRRKKEIGIEIHQSKEEWNIRMLNPVEWAVDEQMLGKASTKEEKEQHGYGVQNVIKAVKRNGGTIVFQTKEEVFQVDISLPFLSENSKKSLLILSESDGN